WIDVGGTFTDSFARRPDGTLAHYKVLSSGTVTGAASQGSTATLLVDPARVADPPDVWRGYTLRLLDAQGHPLAESPVAHFDPRTTSIHLAQPLTSAPQPGQRYELLGGEAPLVAIRYLLGLAGDQPIPPVTVRLGTTRGTNALLTRRGART